MGMYTNGGATLLCGSISSENAIESASSYEMDQT